MNIIRNSSWKYALIATLVAVAMVFVVLPMLPQSGEGNFSLKANIVAAFGGDDGGSGNGDDNGGPDDSGGGGDTTGGFGGDDGGTGIGGGEAGEGCCGSDDDNEPTEEDDGPDESGNPPTEPPVEPEPPVCTVNISVDTIEPGESVRINYSSDNTARLIIEAINANERRTILDTRNPAAMTGSITDTPEFDGLYRYKVTVRNSINDADNCEDRIHVQEEEEAPELTCDATLNASVIDKGDSVTLTYTSDNAERIIIEAINANERRTILDSTSASALSGSITDTPNYTGLYRYKVTVRDGNGNVANCEDSVHVDEDGGGTPSGNPARCDTFSVDDAHLDDPGTVTLSWTTTRANRVSINNGVGDVDDDGSTDVYVDDDTTYTLTAYGTDGNDDCSVHVDVDTGGSSGGGGVRPRCIEFNASDYRVAAGERVVLDWRTRRGYELTIEDDRDNEIFATDDRDVIENGEIVVRPIRDTEYTLTVERKSSRDRCDLDINVGGGGISVITDRDRQPLTSIVLTDVPYTGFDAGPFLTSVFYVLVGLWSMAVAYVLVIKKGTVFGFALPFTKRRTAAAHQQQGAAIPQHEYAPAPAPVRESVATAPVSGAPMNLPTGEYAPTYGYAQAQEPEQTEAEKKVATIEAQAHEHNVLLSGDAIRLIIDHADTDEEETAMLDAIIARAKENYPREDGWIIVNRERIAELFRDTAETAPTDAPREQEYSPLTRAIIAGDATAAVRALGNAPMQDLALSASELDHIYRAGGRKDRELALAIEALADAIDGTYNNEDAAVKIAILKAIKATA